MEDGQKLVAEFEKKFEELKKKLGFKTGLEDLDRVFFLRDMILNEGFVAYRLDRQISARMRDTFNSWLEYFHNLILPNPHNMVNSNESKFISEEDKKEVLKMMTEIMVLVSRNSVIGVTRNLEMQARFYDECYEFWENKFRSFAEKIMTKVNESWKDISEK